MSRDFPLFSDIKPVAIEEEMKRSYLDYAMSVIVSRALPDVCDGLKPVHRRILFAMKETGNDYNRPYRKSARAVGEVMSKYHPHSDTAIYDSMVRMAQYFSLRIPLIDGQGNFGSMDGDPAAAMRYTESRLSKAAHQLLEDIDKETVDFQSNYDESLKEPKVLPARFPNLLVNGGSGIAVGMATNIPTHNLSEVIDACCLLVENPMATLEELMELIPGPDFPTGGIIVGSAGIREAYTTGRGSIIIRAKHHIEQTKNDRDVIVLTEIPYQVNKAAMIKRIAETYQEKLIEGISDLRDESDRDGVRVVIELKKDVSTDVVLNQLYKHSQVQTSFGFNMLAIHRGRPEQMSLKGILQAFLTFREEVITKRTRFELKQAREKAHTLIGLVIAVANIDEVIQLIRNAPDRQTAKDELIRRSWPVADLAPLMALVDHVQEGDLEKGLYRLSEQQALAILDLRLHRLTGLEREKLSNDLGVLGKEISEYLSILGSRQRILDILVKELQEIKASFGSARKTEIQAYSSTLDIEDLIQPEEMVVTVSQNGYIKRVPLPTYRAQKRGGKGRSAMTTREEDNVSDIFVANTLSPVLFFSSTGRVYQLKVYKLPLGTPQSKGRSMVNLLPLSDQEQISTVMILPEESLWHNMYVMFATSKGHVRRNRLSDFLNIKANGKIAIKLEEGETLISVNTCTEEEDIVLFTKKGKCIRFSIKEVRVFAGRDSNGVRGIRLSKDDVVISMTTVHHLAANADERTAYLKQRNQDQDIEAGMPDDEESTTQLMTLSPERVKEMAAFEQFILTITENGYGKRSSTYEYRTTGRGGSGIDSIVVNQRNGSVIASFPVTDQDQIMLVTDNGQLIRCPVHDIRVAGRRTQGVIIFRVGNNEKVVAVSKIPHQEDIEGEEEES